MTIYDHIYQTLPSQLRELFPPIDEGTPEVSFEMFIENVRVLQINVLLPLFREMVRTQNETGLWMLLRARGNDFLNEDLTEGQQESSCGRIVRIFRNGGYSESYPCPTIIKKTITAEHLEEIEKRELYVTASSITAYALLLICVIAIAMTMTNGRFWTKPIGLLTHTEVALASTIFGSPVLALGFTVFKIYWRDAAPLIPIRFDEII